MMEALRPSFNNILTFNKEHYDDILLRVSFLL